MSLIVRTYDSEQPARELVKVLEEQELCLGEIVLVSPAAPVPARPADGAGAPPAVEEPQAAEAPQALDASIERDNATELAARVLLVGKLLGEAADPYAQALGRGQYLVIANPYFGRGRLVIEIMESFGPTDVGVRPPAAYVPYRLPAAPLSKLLFLPVLIRNMPAPLSEQTLGIPVLSRGRSFFSRRYAELTAPDYSFSARFGWPLLSGKPAPLSSALGLPTKTRRQAPWRSSFGLPLLSGNPAPLSSLLNLPLLSSDPAPLSRALGMETLSSRRD